MSQSLIHQVSVSDARRCSNNPIFSILVSIPYSSGLSFRLYNNVVMHEHKSVSQSLIHQVSVSDTYQVALDDLRGTVSIPYSSGLSFR